MDRQSSVLTPQERLQIDGTRDGFGHQDAVEHQRAEASFERREGPRGRIVAMEQRV